jgi:uncharacterized protein (DUF433 family)
MNLVLGIEDAKSLPISMDREIMSGIPVFKGTRVPIDALWNNLASGISLDAFLENFPSVRREDAVRLIEFANRSMLALAYAA